MYLPITVALFAYYACIRIADNSTLLFNHNTQYLNFKYVKCITLFIIIILENKM